jgi:hypothetical protein
MRSCVDTKGDTTPSVPQLPHEIKADIPEHEIDCRDNCRGDQGMTEKTGDVRLRTIPNQSCQRADNINSSCSPYKLVAGSTSGRIDSDVKQCTECGKVKPLTEFHREKNGKYGRGSSCMDCRNRYRRSKYQISAQNQFHKDITTKKCASCNTEKAVSEFYIHCLSSDGYSWKCKACSRKFTLDYKHSLGLSHPMDTSKECSVYLGVHVAERALSNVFKNVEHMLHGNTGYDFICGKGYKIDAKSSVLHTRNIKYRGWVFHIRQNKIADYFACLAFDNRDSLTPLHFWLIPGEAINRLPSIEIRPTTLHKWSQYEQPIDKVFCGCNLIKSAPDIELLPVSIGVE